MEKFILLAQIQNRITMCNLKSMNNRLLVTAIIFCLLPAGQLFSQDAPADKTTSGPPKGTLTEELFRRVLEGGGVIGGSSAGATIQGSFLARGDTENNQVMMGDHQEGFGYISNIAIDQHVLARNRQFDMYGILREHPELLGIGIDENTAVVVQRDTMEVIGASYVLVYDGSFWSREGIDLKILPQNDFLFYMLRQGDRYNLREREFID